MRMTVQQYALWIAPVVQGPVSVRRVEWLEADDLEWSAQYPGVLDAGARAFARLQGEPLADG